MISGRPIPNGVDELLRRRDQPNAVGQGIEQHAGQFGGMLVQQGNRAGNVVERNDDDIVECPLWRTRRDGNTRRRIPLAPVPGLGDLADFGVIVGAVISPFGFGDLGATGKRPRRLDRHHHRFGPRIDESDFVKWGCPRTEVFGKCQFLFGRHGEGGPPRQLPRNRFHHRWISVAMDQRSHVVGEINPRHAVDIDDLAPFPVVRIIGMGPTIDGVSADPTRQDFQGAIVQLLTLRTNRRLCRI